MKLPILASVALSCACVTAAAAPVVPLKDQPVYWGVSYSWIEFEPDVALTDEASDISIDGAKTGAITARLGYQFVEMLSVEARYMHGVRGDDVTISSGATGSSVSVPVELDNMYGVYGKVNLLTDINFTPYLILGYTQAEASSAGGSADDNDFSYGVGIDFCRDQPVCLHAEYMSYLAKDEFDASGMTLGLRVNF